MILLCGKRKICRQISITLLYFFTRLKEKTYILGRIHQNIWGWKSFNIYIENDPVFLQGQNLAVKGLSLSIAQATIVGLPSVMRAVLHANGNWLWFLLLSILCDSSSVEPGPCNLLTIHLQWLNAQKTFEPAASVCNVEEGHFLPMKCLPGYETDP